MTDQQNHKKQRVEWVDLAKGLTILLVVIMHATLGVEKYLGAEGWMHHVITFATPFRMPVFFAVAGLFAAKAITKDWRTFLDSKFLHFAYFYILWMTIQFIFKTPFFIKEFGAESTILYYIASFVQPFGLLWFIYLLPIYFLFLRLTKSAPMLGQFAFAIACKYMLTDTGINVVDFFSKYYVFFLAGHFGRDLWFRLAEMARDNRVLALAGLAVWALSNGAVIHLGYSDVTPVAIVLGVLGFVAVVELMAILPQRGPAQILHYCGQRSLPIYLGFFLPMGVSRLLIPKLCEVCSAGMVAFIVSAFSILGAIVMVELVKAIGIGSFLYIRPGWARLKHRRSNLAAAE